ncbi:uncharacterized protein LOC109919292 [Rhincodon typus]|uniref:uncharacterized protein LOC109919292 n=1 Tax=Rhincodon typus TaxID=259920 RepID=UPI0009A4256C|nr:uncharacterized protein LOC109919292 [Rhincodon typus]XP_020374870.1 uncharacterized protein LOC109919292 [Rhincodon typus]XP_048468132.1 uncharacterized protein LOC109919292 [Rhincodon typus]XP_048468133.1 uncharacterized protein LOC109919292 [Rhincodon typus]XP_048468134.1 uncharacterized protein LOC109919292 [Rhincodon typus]
MNQNQLDPQPQVTHTPKPSAGILASADEKVHSSVASPASGSAASPSPTTGSGLTQSVSSPGTYIQIPINAEVRWISTFSLPTAVQHKIFGGANNLPKGGEGSKPTTAIYIYPVNPVKVTEANRLLPLVPKPLPLTRGASGGTVPAQETSTASPVAKVSSKEPSGRHTKVSRTSKACAPTPTPVSVKFCDNLASQVLKTFVRQQAKGASMDSLMKAYSNSPLETKFGSSFKDNALLLFDGQLYFLAQKGIEIPTGAEKGRQPVRRSCDPKVVPAEEERLAQRIEGGRYSLNTSNTRQDADSPDKSHERDTKGKEKRVKRNKCSNTTCGMDVGGHDASAHPVENGSNLGQEVVKKLPNTLSGKCAHDPWISKDRDLLLKAGIHADVRVCLNRISSIDLANTSGCRLESPMKYVTKFSEKPDPMDLKKCAEHSLVPGPAELEECPELIREHYPTEFRECPKLFKECAVADLEGGLDALRVPDMVASQECPVLSKELPLEECAAISEAFSPPKLEKSPAILKKPGSLTLEECHNYSKTCVTIELEGVDADNVLSTVECGEHSDPAVSSSSADLMDCLSESEEGDHSKLQRKRKEVEIVTSECTGLDWTAQSVTAKKRKQPQVNLAPETSADSQMESGRDLDVGNLERVDNEKSPPTLPSCFDVSSALELNSLVTKEEERTSPSFHKSHPPDCENTADLSWSNPLEVDETIRDEKINRLKEMLKEKQAALDQMRKKISLSDTASYSTLESCRL